MGIKGFRRAKKGKLSAREAIVFAIVAFIGLWIGNFVNAYLPDEFKAGTVGGIVSFLIPILIVYVLWKRFGERAAR